MIRTSTPDIDDAEQAMVAAAAGEFDEAAFAEWLRARVTFIDSA